MSYRVFENKAFYGAAHNPPNYTHAVSVWDVWEYAWDGDLVARCPTRDAAEAARRLLSGECARELADAQMDRLVAAKTGAGKPMRALGATWARKVDRSELVHPDDVARMRTESYEYGVADGAAQERARIVAFAKTYVKSPIRADVLAEMIERGEAGE